jgi:outer membrane protein
MNTASLRALSVALFSISVSLYQTACFADAASPNEIRAGLYALFYDASAQNISGPYAPAGLNLSVKNVQTLYLAYVRTLTDHFNLELALGYPPITKTYGKGPSMLGSVPYNDVELSSARWAAPTLLLNYKFLNDNYALRPYLGAGINYVSFYDRESTAGGNAASGGPTQISLSRSLGPAVTAGLSYRLARNWGLYASYSYSRVRSDLTADTAGVIRTTRISFAPGALVVSAGFSF